MSGKGSVVVGFVALAVIVSLPDVARHTWEKTTGWFDEVTAGDPFREEELEHWPGHPDAHPGYLDLRERVFELIPRVLYTAGQKEIDGIPIKSNMVLTDRAYVGGTEPETYDFWELIAEKKVPIYEVVDILKSPEAVVRMFPKNWDRRPRLSDRVNGKQIMKEDRWRAFIIDVADPRDWNEDERSRQKGDYIPSLQSLTFYVLVDESEGDPNVLEIKKISIVGDRDNGRSNRSSMWYRYLSGRINSPYSMPVFNGDAWHAASGWQWTKDNCVRHRSEAFCDTLHQNMRIFLPPGKKMEDLYKGLAD